MMTDIRSVLMMTVLLVPSLCAWRLLYPIADIAVFSLAPLAAIVFFGTYCPAIGMHRAKMEAAIISGTDLSELSSGRLLTIAFSAAFTLIAITVLAWLALTMAVAEAVALLVLCFLASGLSLQAQAWLASRLHPPFARSIGMGLGYAAAASVFVFVLIWVNYNHVTHPGYIRVSGLPETIDRYINELPERRSPVDEALSFFYAIDAIKIWFVANIGNSFWIRILYCLDAALVAFIVAKSSAAITDFFQQRSK